jgi:hypothetical protein
MYRRRINLKWLYDEFGILRWEASLFPSRYSPGITRKMYYFIIHLIEVYVLILQESLSVRNSEETIQGLDILGVQEDRGNGWLQTTKNLIKL